MRPRRALTSRVSLGCCCVGGASQTCTASRSPFHLRWQSRSQRRMHATRTISVVLASPPPPTGIVHDQISPPNFNKYLSPGPLTNLVPLGRECARLMGPFSPGRIVQCKHDRLCALRCRGAREAVGSLRVHPSRGDPSGGRQRVVAAPPFLLPLLFVFLLPPSPSPLSPPVEAISNNSIRIAD